MNDAKVTIRLPTETLLFVHEYAKMMRIPISELVLRYFNSLQEVADESAEMPASVREVVGIIPRDVNVKKMYRDHQSRLTAF